MVSEERKTLEAAGFQVGDAADVLGLSPDEAALVEVRLADALWAAREASGESQATLARRIGSSQSRVAKAERADPSVSTDLMRRTLFGTGATPADVFARKVTRTGATPLRERKSARSGRGQSGRVACAEALGRSASV